jgi:prevent-host-death family protein
MERHVSLREVNQHLSTYIDAVEHGEEIVITRRGHPVARLVAIPAERALTAEQRAAAKRVRARMSKGYRLGGETVRREEIYER